MVECVKSSFSIPNRQVFLSPRCIDRLYDGLMDIKTIVATWIRTARESAELSGEQLGMRLEHELGTKRGHSKANISHWELGKHQPSLQQLLAISKITGSPLPPEIAASIHEVHQERWAYESTSDPTGFRKVPVIGKGMGGIPNDRTWTDGDFPPGGSDKYALIATGDENAFIARVEEGSMAPRYQPGEYFLVEPNTVPEPGEDVLVRFRNEGTSLKRLLYRRDGFITLGSYSTTETKLVEESEIMWMYYVAHPVPVRNIKNRF